MPCAQHKVHNQLSASDTSLTISMVSVDIDTALSPTNRLELINSYVTYIRNCKTKASRYQAGNVCEATGSAGECGQLEDI